MSTNESLSKLKLPDLRKMCKEMNKSSSGNKMELIHRILEEDGQQGHTIAPEEEAALLGDADQTVADLSDAEIEDCGKVNKQEKSCKRPLPDDDDDQPVKKRKSSESDNLEDSGWDTHDDGVTVTLSEEDRLAKRAERFKTIGSERNNHLTDERLLARAKRFGIPVSESEDEKLKSRAERFGTVTAGTKSVVNSDDKLAKRRERFNLVEDLSVSKPIKGISSASSSAEKLAQRAKRFGLDKTSSEVKTSPIIDVDSNVAKLKARDERFGITKISAPI